MSNTTLNNGAVHGLENVKVTRDDSAWEAEIQAEISAEKLSAYRDAALAEIQKTAQLDGFRPGKAPVDRILAIYGESVIMRRAAEIAIQEELPALLAAENLPVVEAPRVSTGTPESGKPLSFTARAALAPEITLADYAAIGAKHREKVEDTSVSDTEQQDALTHLRRERARIDKIEAGTDPQKAAEESKAMQVEELPELDDAFVQSLGYESAAAFSEALRANIQTEKEMRASEKRRAAILDDLVKDSKVAYPQSLRGYEIEDMEARLKDDLSRIGRTLEQYLAETKKTRDELLASWGEAADKRVKVRLILSDIARKEAIDPDSELVEHELEHAKQHYPSADPDAMRANIAHAMRNEMTLRFLETGERSQLPAHDHGHDHDHE